MTTDHLSTTEDIQDAKTPGGLGRNFLWMAWSGVVSIANSVLVWVVLARMRDIEEVGHFTIVMGLYALFFSAVSLGLMPFLINEISRRASASVNKFVSSAGVFLTLSGIVSAVLMTGTGILVSGSSEVRIATAILSLAMLPSGIIALAEATAIAYGRARIVAAVSTVENTLRTIIPLALILNDHGIIAICISFAAVRFVALAAYLLVGWQQLARFAFVSSEFIRIAKVTPTFAGTVVFASVNWQAPVILLGYLSTDAELAEFGAASRFLIPVAILMASYANAVQPSIVQAIGSAPETARSYIGKVLSYPVAVAVAAAIGSLLFSRPILSAMFGAGYEPAAPILNILALGTIPFCIVMIAARALVAVRSERIDLYANVLGVASCFCAGILLIPEYGARGAALAQLISFALMALIETVCLARRIGGSSLWRVATVSSACILVLGLWN